VPFELLRDEVINVRLGADQKRVYDQRKRGLSKSQRAELLKRMDNKILDEDILFQKAGLDDSQLKTLLEIDEGIQALAQQQRKYPDAFSPHAGMSLLDIKAQVAAMLGRPQEAVDMLAEYWRQANRMDMHSEAARAAKMKGDIQMVQAFAGHNPELKRHNIDRGRVLEAIRTYSEEGVKSLTSVDPKSFYHVSVRINRIRAIGALAMSYDYDMKTKQPKPEEVRQMVEEFKPYLETALKDFNYLNQKRHGGAKRGDVQYYLMGYFGHICKFARTMGLGLPDFRDGTAYPYATDLGLNAAQEFAASIEDSPTRNLGEKRRKLEGIAAMRDFVGLEM